MSAAIVTVVEDWNDGPTVTLEVPPLHSPTKIASSLREGLARVRAAEDTVLVVERRWIVDSLPDREILDAIAYCFSELTRIVAQAHTRCGVSIAEDRAAQGVAHDLTRARLPRCMTVNREARTARIRLSTGQMWDLRCVPAAMNTSTPERMTVAAGRYGLDTIDYPKLEAIHTSSELFAIASIYSAIGGRLLIKDGYLHTFAHLFTDDGQYEVRQLVMEDRVDRLLMFRELSNEIRTQGWSGLIVVGEVWFASIEESLPTRGAVTDIPGHREAMQVSAVYQDGRIQILLTPFNRTDKGILLDPTETWTESDMQANFLRPILDAWRDG